MGRRYNKNCILYPLSTALEAMKLIFAIFICVTQRWALHVVIEQQFFKNIYIPFNLDFFIYYHLVTSAMKHLHKFTIVGTWLFSCVKRYFCRFKTRVKLKDEKKTKKNANHNNSLFNPYTRFCSTQNWIVCHIFLIIFLPPPAWRPEEAPSLASVTPLKKRMDACRRQN